MDYLFDIGNTRTKFARYLNGERRTVQTADRLSAEFLNHLSYNPLRDRALFSSTKNLPDPILAIFQKWKAHELSHETPLPYQVAYATPRTLGRDRMAVVAGAQREFPNRNCLVIDAGTCVTYEWLTAAGTYRGGNISPGLRMRLRAMYAFTDKLPEVTAELPARPIGDRTRTALQNGALRGLVHEIEGYLRWTGEHFPDPVVLLTGGDGEFLVSQLNYNIFARPNLVLDGLAHILDQLNEHPGQP